MKMGIRINNTGKKFGRLTAIEPTKKRSGDGSVMWKCKCDCGNVVFVSSNSLRRGLTKSCSCLAKELAKKRLTIHGKFGTTEWDTWSSMKQRCYNKDNPYYNNYGGRGIKVCERWRNSFTNFLEDMGKKPSPELSIDRINNNGNYDPSNCKWTTTKEQLNNRRSNLRISVTGHRFWSNTKKERDCFFSSLDLLLPHLVKKVVFLGGCAYGVDTWFLEFARKNGINFHMYFPFNRITQIVRSPKEYDSHYTKELNKQYEAAKKIIYVNKTFHTQGYQKRNIALVENAELLCTYYTRQRSGSGNCRNYAVTKELPILDLRLKEDDLKKEIRNL